MRKIMRKINMLSRCESLYRQNSLKEKGISPCHHSYILAICRNPGMTQEQLAKYICIDKSGVARHLAHLEKSGYVERTPAENDKRSTLVYPTQKMLDILPEVRKIVEDWNSYLTDGIDEEELLCFEKILDRITMRAQSYVYEKEDTDK